MKSRKLRKRAQRRITKVVIIQNWSIPICVLLLLMGTPFAFPHGTVTSPPSRIWNCYLENPENPTSEACIAAVNSHGSQPLYDWNEINQPNADGEHMLYVFDGNLPSGGRPDKYGGMDQVRSDWVATPVSAGPFTVTWTNTAPHESEYYEVYITAANWSPDQPLTWDSLELLVRTDPSPPAESVDIDVVLPPRAGKHVIYSIWQRSDSPEAFYSTSDVDFGLLSIDDSEAAAGILEVWPNPADGGILHLGLTGATTTSYSIYNLLGEKVVESDFSETIDVSGLVAGVYLIVVEIEGRKLVTHFIIE